MFVSDTLDSATYLIARSPLSVTRTGSDTWSATKACSWALGRRRAKGLAAA